MKQLLALLFRDNTILHAGSWRILFPPIRRHYFRLIVICASLIGTLPLSLLAPDIGSDTGVNAYTTQQYLYANGRVASFAALSAGFKIYDLGSTTTFDSFFPVSGDIDLQAGTLTLNKDLMTQDTAYFSPGNIMGYSHSLEFAQTVSQIPKLSAAQNSCDVALIGGTTDRIAIYSTNYATALYSVDFSFDSQFAAFGAYRSTNSPTSARGTSVVIYANPTTTSFAYRDYFRLNLTRTPNYMNLVRWHPSKYVLAAALNNNSLKELRILSFDGSSSLTEITQSAIPDFGVNCYAVAWHPSGDYLAVAKASSPYIQVYGFNQTTNLLTSVVASSTTNYVTQKMALDWDPTGNYLAIGYNSSPYMTILKFTPTGFTQTINAPVGTFPGTVNSLRWNPLLPNLLGVATEAGSNKVRIIQFDPDTASISNYVLASESNTQSAVDWGSCGNCLSAARAATASNHRMYTFTQSPLTLTAGTAFSTVGATLSETRYDPSGQYFIDAATNGYVARRALIGRCTNPVCRTFTDLNLYLNNDLLIRDCCITFVGKCSLIGRNNTLSLASTCTLQIDNASTLLLKDITVKTMNSTHINCITDNSTLSLSNATLVLGNDYLFQTGALDIANDVHLQGPGRTFYYLSNQPCTIGAQSSLTLDNALIFQYNPQLPSPTLLQFIDNSSQLVLLGSTLSAAQNLQLLKGTLLIDGAAHLAGAGTISFGDGVSANNNMTINWLPAAQLISTGSVILADTKP